MREEDARDNYFLHRSKAKYKYNIDFIIALFNWEEDNIPGQEVTQITIKQSGMELPELTQSAP